MKTLLLPAMLAVLVLAPQWASAQNRVYRCGNEYTNRPANPKACKLVDGGNVTIIQGTRPRATDSGERAAAAPAAAPRAAAPRAVSAPQRAAAPTPSRINTPEQASRDSDARAILQAELRRAESRQAELVKEYNNGNPNWKAGEPQMPTKYQARVGEMKAAIDRNQADIDGIRRELQRHGGG